MTTVTTCSPATRFVALDVHRQYLVVGAVDAQQHVVLSPRRFGFEAFQDWAPTHLTVGDMLVLEATSNAWLLYDQLKPLVADVIVAHPQAVKLIAAARVKTDSRDTIKLASLLAANLIPAVWVPPPEVRELRALVAHRKRLVQQRTQAGNRLHAVLHRHNLVLPAGKPFAAHQREWWRSLDLPVSEKLRVQQDLSLHQALEELVKEVEAELGRLSTCEPWVKQVPFLVQLPGLGVLSAMRVLAAIGDITRFPSAKHLVGYAGLGASVHESGETHRGGHITKEGCSDLRGVMVEAAWVAVEHHSHWKAQFERLSARIGKQKAIVAIARKLLVSIWHVLSQQEADSNAQIQAVTHKLMNWIAHTGATPGKKRDRLLLLYQYLDQLGLSEEVEEINYYGQTYRLSLRQKLLRGAQQRKERQDSLEIHPDVSASQQHGRCRP
jgi:transposase